MFSVIIENIFFLLLNFYILIILITLILIKAQSKTANILFAVELTRRYAKDGIYTNSLMPGYIMTELVTKNGTPDSLKSAKFIDENGRICPHVKSVEQGAATSVWAAVAPELENKGGLYLDDCSIAEPAVLGNENLKGYASYALDPENAKNLWNISEELLSQSNPPIKAAIRTN
jgi:hypothetical protein